MAPSHGNGDPPDFRGEEGTAMKRLFGLMVSIAVVGAIPAQAADLARCSLPLDRQQDLGCVCVMPLGMPVATLGQLQGQVLKTAARGYVPIQGASANLFAGDQVLFGSDGQGVVA